MATIPVVRDVKLKTNLFGRYFAVHHCPHCKDRLKLREFEIGKPDECPDCGGNFAVSKRILIEIQKDRAQLKDQKNRGRRRKSEAGKDAKERAQMKKEYNFESQFQNGEQKSSRYLGRIVFLLVSLPVLYVLSPPFVLAFLSHMYDWFGIKSWFGADVLGVLQNLYAPLQTLVESSGSFQGFMDWYFGLFPDWFIWGAGGPPYLGGR